jgi:hypothetical protein
MKGVLEALELSNNQDIELTNYYEEYWKSKYIYREDIL